MRHSRQVLPGSPREWLRYARSDYTLGSIKRPNGVMLETLCYHAQQCAEKALKAVLLELGVTFPYTHNIKTLLEHVPKTLQPPPDVLDAARLTQYAVAARYPEDNEPILSDSERRNAIRLAKSVLRWAEEVVGKGVG